MAFRITQYFTRSLVKVFQRPIGVPVRQLSVSTSLFRQTRYGDDQYDMDYEERRENAWDDFRSPSRRRPPTGHDRYANRMYGQRTDDRYFGDDARDVAEPNFDGQPEIVKNLYSPGEVAQSRSAEEVAKFRADNRITIVRGEESVPNPVLAFDEVGFPEDIARCIGRFDFESPMPIQSQGWPIAMSGKDVVAIGETGSGKTLGFLLPAIVHIRAQQGRAVGPRVVVMAPTRELAQQIESVARKFSSVGVRSACVFGGASRFRQIRQLEEGANLVIATPGRLIDLAEDGAARLESTSYLVLDEADRMLDMGFEPQIRRIIRRIRPDRQLLMWSATWPSEVRELAADLFPAGGDHVHLKIGSAELQANKMIEQNVHVVERHDKMRKLLDIIDEAGEGRILIFASTKRTVDYICNALYRNGGHRADGIHGDKSQARRDFVLSNFRKGHSKILVATDVASRGLDVDDIKVVINYDFPTNIEDYVHRIGRTGRRGRSGVAHSFISESDSRLARSLQKVLEEAGQEVSEDLRNLRDFGSSENNNKRRPRYRSGSYDDRFRSYRPQRSNSFNNADSRSSYNREFVYSKNEDC